MKYDLADLDCILFEVRKLKENGGNLSVEEAWNDFAFNEDTPLDVKCNRLSRMKSVVETLSSITKSLESHVERATAKIVPEARVTGFASLPDELLARIFDLYYQDYLVEFYPESCYETNPPPRIVLPKVCKRFRRLAHRLPALWEIVRLNDNVDDVKFLKTKCQSPRVYININLETEVNEVRSFLDATHRHNRWKELNLEFEDDEWAVRIFKMLDPNAKNASFDFSSLTSLSISSRGCDADEDFVPSFFPAECCEAFNKWQMHSLTSLSLTNIIPDSNLSLGDLQEASITLGNPHGMLFEGTYEWDMGGLGQFILSLNSLHSLTMKFDGADTANVEEDLVEVGCFRQLSKLTSLSVIVSGKTEPLVLKQFMEMVGMPKLRRLDLDIHWTRPDEPARYIDALLKATPGTIRTLPFVQEASIRIQHSGGMQYSGATMFRALPRLSTLSLATPGFKLPYFIVYKEEFGCFEDLHTLRLDSCKEHRPLHLVNSLPYKVDQAFVPLDKLQTLELVGCCGLMGARDELQTKLGNMLVWKI
ncbi:hypothetical protein SCHPADRAFT_995900 [Schizopora paradoxa]|uniref:F-box domain-containing protein n=1 Tax=Schizopora paradoxa TaxID=27342 RepID=A0A0H2S108_9AGAM|nr:hypothetical protein SCHPADRAFT_995900 [Schizopora paradoxa]